MIQFLRALGFRGDSTDIKKLVREVIHQANSYYEIEQENTKKVEYVKEFGEGFGLVLRGEMDEESWLNIFSIAPYAQGSDAIPGYEIEMVDEAGESGSAYCEEENQGTLFSFYLQKLKDWQEIKEESAEHKNVSLVGFSVEGMVIFPVAEAEDRHERELKEAVINTGLLERARNGDESAADELITNAKELTRYLYERIQKEEMLTVLREYFYPENDEDDVHSVLGEIKEVKLMTNVLTSRTFYCLKVESMGIPLNIYISPDDLTGLPTAGMRFKGMAWLHGSLVE